MRRGTGERSAWFTLDASGAFQAMPPWEQIRWAARIDRIAAGKPYRATRKVHGARDLFRLEADGWMLLYRVPARGKRVVIVSFARRRLDRLVEEALGRGGAGRERER